MSPGNQVYSVLFGDIVTSPAFGINEWEYKVRKRELPHKVVGSKNTSRVLLSCRTPPVTRLASPPSCRSQVSVAQWTYFQVTLSGGWAPDPPHGLKKIIFLLPFSLTKCKEYSSESNFLSQDWLFSKMTGLENSNPFPGKQHFLQTQLVLSSDVMNVIHQNSWILHVITFAHIGVIPCKNYSMHEPLMAGSTVHVSNTSWGVFMIPLLAWYPHVSQANLPFKILNKC